MTRLPLDPRLQPQDLGTLEPSAVVIVGALVLAAFATLVLLSWTSMHSGGAVPGDAPPDDDGPGGPWPHDGEPHDGGPPRPAGGIPLPDARPARVRLRGRVGLRDVHRSPARRGVAEPVRVPSRQLESAALRHQ